MQELFRFSVVRPIGKSRGITVPLAAPPPQRGKTPATPGQTFHQALQSALTNLRAGFSNESIWSRLEQPAAAFLVASSASITADPLWTEVAALPTELTALTDSAAPQPDTNKIKAVFTAHPTLTAQAVIAYQAELSDLFLASIIVRRGGSAHLAALIDQVPGLAACVTIELSDVASRLQGCKLALDGPQPLSNAITGAADPKAALLATIEAILNATILLPPVLTAKLAKPVLGAGMRELHVVKQHIRRYERSEIARIENILLGELRDHQQKHSISTEQDTFLQTIDTTETDKELDTNDKTSIKTEASDQVKTDTKIDGGVHAQYSGPSFKLQADLTASYDRAEDTSKKYSAETAKEVTQKAATKVTDQVTRSRTTKVIEKLIDWERQRFDNEKGTKNIAGVYQWVQKVYLSQVFNLGRHLLIDITVPEPGANLLAMATSSSALEPAPVQPRPLGTVVSDAQGHPILDQFGHQQLKVPLDPLDLSEKPLLSLNHPDPNFYGTWVGLYGATGVSAPPAPTRTFSKGKSFDYEDDSDKAEADSIAIDDGYEGVQVVSTISGMRNDNPGGGPIGQSVFVDVSIGGVTIHLPWPNTRRSLSMSGSALLTTHVTGNVDFTVYGHNMDQMTVDIEIVAQRTATAFNAWKLQTFEKIAAAYRDLETGYEASLAARKMATQTVGPLGAADPDQNRLTERTELKRSCIGIFDNSNASVAGTAVMSLNPATAPAVADPSNPQLPEPILATSQDFGARVRWFEQAFEWENMAYVVYPYYWGRREMWMQRFALANDDPMFLSFLQAGYARVVVPVRIGFEQAVQFYLNTGLPWLGGDLPVVGDDSQNPLYLDVAEEIKALTGGAEEGDLEVPVGDPWEYLLPTTTIMLRDDGKLPEWHRIDLGGNESSNAPSNAPIDPWTWRDGPPTI